MSVVVTPTLGALLTSLSAAQGELEDASKSSVNPGFKSKYADLAEILQTVRPVLSKHGLAISQLVGAYNVQDKTVEVTTILGHKSGEYIQAMLVIPVVKADPQGLGSATTYARRYGAAAIIGISQDDDDGNAASGKGKSPSTKADVRIGAQPAKSKMDPAGMRAAFEAVKTSAELDALSDAFADLAPSDQTDLLPIAQAARQRVSKEQA